MTTPEPTPQPPTGKRTAARRRRLAYALAAAILLIAGVVAGVVATRPAPKRHHVAVAVVKPKPKPTPKPATLSSAEFMARWAAVTDGPSAITRGTTQPDGGVSSVVVNVAPGPVWTWHIAESAGTTVTGTASANGATETTTFTHWGPGTPAYITAQGPPPPSVQHQLPGWFSAPIVNGALPLVSVQRFVGGSQERTLSNPVVVAATASSWTVRVTVNWPWCLLNFPFGRNASPAYVARCGAVTHTGPATYQPVHGSSSPPTSATPTERVPGPTATATVTPTAAGGLLISIAPSGFTLLANPA